ncbi:RHS repeat-associated core domain-containing protein, partial [Pseudomonas sp. MWU13-3659]|uniref:RHS repeat-associated core domain-containing protein n=1 Tax=Pseudomonas sp. MWU13-3659 TaxID=2986964 RepID=UPI00207645DA
LNRPLEADPRRNKLMDNLLREYAGTHYKYDERGNLIHRLHNGSHAHFTWDLFDRLASYNDDQLKVDYSYDALGRRLHKHSVAHFWDRPEAGTGWNQLQRAKRQRELGCGFTLFGWDGDTLAWESSPPRDEGDTGRTVHYLYEPNSFVPVAQALRKSPIRLHKQPDWSQREYDFDQDPLWHTEVKPHAFDAIAWYHCDHLGTPMELTDEQGNVAWAGQYKAWGEVREERSAWAKQHGLGNPLLFQGQYHDHETGLHYNRYRYYNPKVGRFVGQDPISYAGGINLYSYARNPVTWVDPLGLCACAKGTASFREVKTVLKSAQAPYKGSTVIGHGLSKHAGRNPHIWGKTTGSMATWNDQAMKHLREISRAPGEFKQVTTDKGLNFMEKRLPDGRGVRLNMDGTFKGFID